MTGSEPSWRLFWAKTREPAGDGPGWHPIAHHGLDVAAVGLTLLQSQAPAPIDPLYWPLVVTLLAWHDIGKFSRPFQAKVPALWPKVLGPYAPNGSPHGHDSIGDAMLRHERLQALVKRLLPRWGNGAHALIRAVCGHHGRPPGQIDWVSAQDVDDACFTAATGFAEAAARCLGAEPVDYPGKPAARRLAWQLAGLAVLADWIGSNEAWFAAQPTPMPLETYWRDHALPQARAAVALAGVLPAHIRPTLKLTDLAPHARDATPLQARAATMALPASGPVLVVIEDQTGAGKTEAALLLAHRLMQGGRGSGLFVALPTMATANAMYARLAKAYRALFDADATPSLVLAHGRRALHEGFQKSILPRPIADDPAATGSASTDWADEPAGAQCAAWVAADRRRAFLADVGVGTIDQALLAVLPSRHAPLRQWGLAQHVLILDEVHAYDAYMMKELETLLEFHAALGGSAILLSATLPRETRERLEKAFQHGAGQPEVVLESAAYPLITLAGAGGARELPCAAKPELARVVAVERIADVETAIARVVAAAQAGQAVAWVRNSVDDAIEAWAALRAAGIAADLFHAHFAMGDRLDIEAAAMARFGRDSTAADRAGRVLVATQVVEQSLDLDFDLMVSDLAPIDLLIQRAGRLWRHARPDRPNAAEGPRLLVLSPPAADDADASWLAGSLRRTRFIYRWSVLWRSARVLFEAGAIVAPAGVRALVEHVYGEPEDVPPGLIAALNKETGAESAAISLAGMNVLQWAEPYVNGGGWNSDIATPTRLSEPSLTVRLGRWAEGVLTPLRADADPRRAWAMSEVSLVRRRVSGVPEPTGALARAVAAAKAGWGRWEAEIPLLVLRPVEGGGEGEVNDAKGVVRGVTYDSLRGLVML